VPRHGPVASDRRPGIRGQARRLTLVTRQNGTITFTAGAVAGILGGFVLGVFFGKYVLQLMSLLYNMVDRRGDANDTRFRFEWLSQ